MGPKVKDKGKAAETKVPEIDPKEILTELQKEFFEFQLTDIEKKLNRIAQREEELTAGTLELELKTEEFKKEKGAVVTEHEQILVAKEEEKRNKREEMCFLSEEVKLRIAKHKEHVQNIERKFNELVTEITAQLEDLEEEIRILEDYKQNKEVCKEGLEKKEQELNETEKQHQRNLFAINKKFDQAKGRVKKELQSRLLQLSIEFRQKSQKGIGNPCHRVTQENKAINTTLFQMKEEIFAYEDRSANAKRNMNMYKSLMHKKQAENDKMLAKAIVQVNVVKILMKDSVKLVRKLREFSAVEQFNRSLLRKLQAVSFEIDLKMMSMNNVNRDIESKIQETNLIREAARHLKNKSRRLLVLIRNAIKVVEEVMAVRLIPMGMMEEEKHLTSERKIKLFRNRRDMVFGKKGRILQYLLEVLSKAQISEEDKKLLTASVDSIDLEGINFSQIYGKPLLDESRTSLHQEIEDEKKKGPAFFTSLTSLPRSVSALLVPDEKASASSEYYTEYGEYEGEDYDYKVEVKLPAQLEMPGEGGEGMEEEDEIKEGLGIQEGTVEDENKSEGSVEPSREFKQNTRTTEKIFR